jgi:hypothetical protein
MNNKILPTLLDHTLLHLPAKEQVSCAFLFETIFFINAELFSFVLNIIHFQYKELLKISKAPQT